MRLDFAEYVIQYQWHQNFCHAPLMLKPSHSLCICVTTEAQPPSLLCYSP